LNWYPSGSPYAVDYNPGEGLDHVALRVEDLPGFLRRLATQGIERVPIDPSLAEPAGARGTSSWFHVEYIKDPDGNWIELFERSDPIGPTPPNAPIEPRLRPARGNLFHFRLHGPREPR